MQKQDEVGECSSRVGEMEYRIQGAGVGSRMSMLDAGWRCAVPMKLQDGDAPLPAEEKDGSISHLIFRGK